MTLAWNDFPAGESRTVCPECGRGPRDKTLGVAVNDDGSGVAHCFRCGYIETRHDRKNLTPSERISSARRLETFLKDAAQKREELQRATAAEAAVKWAAAAPAREHPYLAAKRVAAHGLRIAGNRLMVPMRDAGGHLWNIQTIAPDGEKRFMSGGRLKGMYHAIGQPGDRLILCEGYATGATLHEETAYAVAVAFTCGNLLAVAQSLRMKFPRLSLIVAADDDWKTAGNPGLAAAREAAAAVGGLLAVPNFGDLPRGEKDTDFNDLRRMCGALEVAA